MPRRRHRHRPIQAPSFLPDPDRPLTPREASEYHAVRLALLLRTAIDQCDLFTAEYHVLAPSLLEVPREWLRHHLAPLDRHAPTIATIRTIMDDRQHSRLWDSPEGLRAVIDRLRADIHLLARRSTDRRQA